MVLAKRYPEWQVTSWEYMETLLGDCDFMLKSTEKVFSFLLFQFLTSENFVDWLGLIKCFKDFQNVRNLEIMFFVCKLEPNWFKWRRLQFKCLIVMFLLSRISVFKYIRWLVNCLTVSATLPLSDFSVGAEIIISASGKFSWIKYFNWGNLFKI